MNKQLMHDHKHKDTRYLLYKQPEESVTHTVLNSLVILCSFLASTWLFSII